MSLSETKKGSWKELKRLSKEFTLEKGKNEEGSGDCTNCGNTTEATTLLQQLIKKNKKKVNKTRCGTATNSGRERKPSKPY